MVFFEQLLRKKRFPCVREQLISSPFPHGSILPQHINLYYYRDCTVVESFEKENGGTKHLISFKLNDYQHRLSEREVTGILVTLGMDIRQPIIQFVQKNQFNPGSTIFFMQQAA